MHGELVERLEPLEVDRPERRRPGQLPADDPPDREDDVVGGERLAVVEGDALPERDHPVGRRTVRADVLGQHEFRLGAGVQLEQRLVQRLRAGRVEVGQALVRVEGVRTGSAGQPHLQGAAPPLTRARRGRRRLARSCGGAGTEQAPCAGYRPGRDDPPEELAAFQRVSRFPVIRTFHEIPP